MSEEQQQNIEQSTENVEQAQPADGTVETSTEDKKSAKAKATNTDTKDDKPINGKSQINISNDLKGKLGNLKKNTDTYDSIVQMLYDSYKKKNNIVDKEIESLDEIKSELIDIVEVLFSTYPYTHQNGLIGYDYNLNSLLFKLINCLVLQRESESEDSKKMLKDIQKVMLAIKNLMNTLDNIIGTNIIDKDKYQAEYFQFLSNMISSKMTTTQQSIQSYNEQIKNLEQTNAYWYMVQNALSAQPKGC